jgi:hypothetical protein
MTTKLSDMTRVYGIKCGECERKLCINRCPDQNPNAVPDFDLSAVNWKCPVCGLEAYYHRDSLKVFDETEAQGLAISVGRSWVNREWVGRESKQILHTLDGGPFSTYEEARERARDYPRSFTQMRVEVDS